MDSILQYDQQLFLYLNRLGTQPWDGFWMGLSNKWVSMPVYLLLLFLSYRQFGLKKTLVMILALTLLITATDQLSNFFKYGLQRLRPCYEPSLEGSFRLVKGYCGGKYGFYSAHASNFMGVAVFFTMILGRGRSWLAFLLILWALAIGYSRIYIGVHYPLDVLAGALAGMLLGWLFARLLVLALQKIWP